jgi:hypothetical protein
MAIFMTRVIGPRPFQGLTRVPNIIADIAARAPPQQQAQVASNLFTWIKQGEEAFVKAGIDDAWELFLRKGPGTLPGVSTSGNYHVLDYMANVIGFQAVKDLEVRVGRRFFDLVVEKTIQTASGPATRRVFIELKNLAAFSGFGFGNQVSKDISGAIIRSRILTDGKVSDLIEQLEGIEYVLRGSPQEMAQVIQGIESTIQKILAPHGLQHLASHVRIDALSRTLPF